MALFGTPVEGPSAFMAREEVSVHGIGVGGAGVGTLPNGKVVFLPRTAPGDRVVVELVREKARWAEGKAIELRKEGPGRREPPCPLYPRCDGCSLQHLAYSEQLVWKGRIVGDALRRLGGMEQEDPEVVPSPREFRYRNRVTFSLRRLPGDRVIAGFRELGSPGRVLNVGGECLLPEEPLAIVWRELREAWGPGASRLPGGRELRVTLRHGEAGAGLLIRGGKGRGDPEALVERVPGLGSVWRERRGGRLEHLAGPPTLRVPWESQSIDLPGGGFVQVNEAAGKDLYGYILVKAGDVAGRRIVDAYCGIGILGGGLAAMGAEVVGIEEDPRAVAAARGRPERDFRVVEGYVEQELEALLPADLLLLNPPRVGLGKTVPRLLQRKPVRRVIYVSCDPATLARDLGRLGEAYDVEEVCSFDLFPQTGHVETVVTLKGNTG